MSFSTPEREVVLEIRRNIGVDEDLCLQARQNPAVWKTVQNLKQTLGKSLDVLSYELYSKPAHFVLEILQNADDNSYTAGTTPTVQIVLRKSYMEIKCNEVGFTAENVKAFCGIGQSTKKNQAGYIGEKGIGAKSMFKVANKVYVHSRGFHFLLDRDEELGMIAPQWVPQSTSSPGWTTMRLDFCDDDQYNIVRKQLEHVRNSVLLFMRRLSKLSIDDDHSAQVSISRAISGNIMTMTTEEHGRATRRRFLRIAQSVAAYAREPKREAATTTEVVLAFPLNDSLEPLLSSQMVHAFLPMRTFGFMFIVQADFLTAANREDVLSDLAWNTTIRDAIAAVFMAAFAQFKNMPSLRLTWPRFIPIASSVADPFFSPVVRSIRSALSNTAIVLDEVGAYRRPSAVKFSAAFSLDGNPLIPEGKLSFYYVSSSYPDDVRGTLQDLGVVDMTFDEFIGGLTNMAHSVTTQGNAWLERVCSLLKSHGFRWARSTYYLNDARISQLPIAQLQNGTWTSCQTSSSLFFAPEDAHFPSGLGINILFMDATIPNRRELLQRLGVTTVDPGVVLSKILDVHRSNVHLAMSTMLDHVHYIFKHRDSLSLDSISSLWLADRSSTMCRSSELYMDDPGSGSVLSDVLLSPARFLHSRFLEAPFSTTYHSQRLAWQSFLEDTCGVSKAPRVVNGLPQPELHALIERLRTSQPAQLLDLLRRYWPGIREQFSTASQRDTFNQHLAKIEVRCRNNIVVELRSTFLLESSQLQFETSDMSVLPVADRTADWTFLRNFGVSTIVDAAFFLKRLLALSQVSNVETVYVKALYRQLESRFLDIPDKIRDAFRSQRLFRVGKEWKGWKDVVWDGPDIMTQKASLRTRYYGLEELFQKHLAIGDAPPTIVADELQSFASAHEGSPLTEEPRAILLRLLEYGAKTIAMMKDQKCDDWTPRVRQLAILPVRQSADDIVLLASCDEQFFLPDPSGHLEALFDQQVPFLAIPPSYSVVLRPLLEHLGLAKNGIEQHVTQTVAVDGQPDSAELGVVNEGETARYQSRIRLLQRVQYYMGARSPFVRSITVIDVDHLEATYTVDAPDTSPILQHLACHARDAGTGELELFLVAKSAKRSAIAAYLCHVIGLGKTCLHIIHNILFTDDDEDVEDLLREAGIRDLDQAAIDRLARGSSMPMQTDAPLDRAWQFPAAAAATGAASLDSGSTTDFGRPRKARSRLVPRAPSPDLTALDGDLDAYLATDVAAREIRSLQTHATQTALLVAEDFGLSLNTFAPSATTSLQLTGSVVALNGDADFASIGTPTFRARGSGARRQRVQPDQDERTLRIGYLGELYVFHHLQSNLPDGSFDHNNWTSIFRSRAGFPAFFGESLADFVYNDTDGVLTRKLFSLNHPYRDARPEYFIEVKATSGGQTDAFHMKRSQFLQALKMTCRTNHIAELKQVYVLFRVSGIDNGDTPELKTYVDPHALLSRGLLRIESDSVDVRIVASQ